MVEDSVGSGNRPMPEVTPSRMSAGGNYLRALKDLNFVPELAVWGFDFEEEEFRLFLFSPIVGLKGPVQLYSLLYKAFERHATPSEFDPWIVAIIDTAAPLFEIMLEGTKRRKQVFFRVERETGRQIPVHGMNGGLIEMIGSILYHSDWAYKPPAHEHLTDAVDQWRMFEEGVERFAA